MDVCKKLTVRVVDAGVAASLRRDVSDATIPRQSGRGPRMLRVTGQVERSAPSYVPTGRYRQVACWNCSKRGRKSVFPSDCLSRGEGEVRVVGLRVGVGVGVGVKN